jgi:methylenetetrahydrofolate reductase (NADPH)
MKRMPSTTAPIEGSPSAFDELISNASIEIAPRERAEIERVAEALPVNSCIYVPAPARRPLSETLDAVAAIRRAGLDPVPHIAARRFASRAELAQFLAMAVAEHGVHRVMLIGGDEPRAHGPYADALQVLEDGVLNQAGIREVGLAGYPEGHARIASAALETAFSRKLGLAREQRLGVYVVTQFSFSTTRVTAFCAELARREPELPVYVGMAGPTDPVALMRYAQVCGVSASLRAMRNLGAGMVGLASHTDPHEQLLSLARYSDTRKSCNVVGIHLYSFGGAVRTAHWLRDRLHQA